MENLYSGAAIMDGVTLLRHHMYRFKSYGFIVAHFMDRQNTDSELGDSLCLTLKDPTWAGKECSLPGTRILVISRVEVE